MQTVSSPERSSLGVERAFRLDPAWQEATKRARLAAHAVRALAARVPSYGWSALVCLGLGFATLVSFAHLAEDYVTNDPLVGWDERIARWLHAEATATGVDVFSVISIAGGTAFLAVVTAAAALLLLRRDRLDGAYVAAAFLGAEALTLGLKLAFARERPVLDHPFVDLHTYSFPSGHASISIAVYGAIAILLARRSRSWWPRVGLLVATLALVGLIGFSRLYLGAHFLSDVLAGYDAGFTWLMTCTAAWAVLRARRRAGGRS